MEEKILVPLRNSDEVYGVTPYLETIAKPGARVIFLVRCSTDGCGQPLDRTVLLEPGLPSSVVRRQISARWSWEYKKRLAEDAILSACQNLRKHGVNVQVNVHSRNINKVVRNYVLYGSVNFVVVGPRYRRLRIFFQWVPGFWCVFKQPPAVLLFHAGQSHALT
jgi:hypothetical protein